jgi:class 3 adenylate cyclase
VQAESAGTHFVTEAVGIPTKEIDLSDMSKSPTAQKEIGWIAVREDPDSDHWVRHPIQSGATVIGRSADCNIRIEDLGVSRVHAEVVWEGRDLVLYHRSKTNLTQVNRRDVTHRLVVHNADEVLLAGRVTLRIDLGPDDRFATGPSRPSEARKRIPAEPGAGHDSSGLHAVMERKLALDQKIVDEFSVEGSFMDIDVVNSMGMKTDIAEPERIIVSFERFRAYVAGIVAEFQGHLLNSNGDELMCFFASSLDAVRAGSAVFTRLDRFNQAENVLDAPFRFRIGVHSGRSFVDLKRGIAYSAVLDAAGHLQKVAPPDHMAISEQTMNALPAGLPFQRTGRLESEKLDYYVLLGAIS